MLHIAQRRTTSHDDLYYISRLLDNVPRSTACSHGRGNLHVWSLIRTSQSSH